METVKFKKWVCGVLVRVLKVLRRSIFKKSHSGVVLTTMKL